VITSCLAREMASRVFNPKRRLQTNQTYRSLDVHGGRRLSIWPTPNAQAIDDEADQHQGAQIPRSHVDNHALSTICTPSTPQRIPNPTAPLPKKSFKKESLPSGARGHAPTKPPTGPVTTAPGIKSDQNVARGVRPPLEISVPPSLTLLLASRAGEAWAHAAGHPSRGRHRPLLS
jgi:hypothetical protein